MAFSSDCDRIRGGRLTDPQDTALDYKCEFIAPKNYSVRILTTTNATGAFQAYAIQSNDKSRDVLLSSDLCETVLKSVESLYKKSCDAVNDYISTNGFSHLALKEFGVDDDGNDDGNETTPAASISFTGSMTFPWTSLEDGLIIENRLGATLLVNDLRTTYPIKTLKSACAFPMKN
ncbi:hypothetical protein M434DRAFT_14843 [Hypoxylon sp. CO27-5]|nr:hypothetical protein M434DRAFT_14843 [Hypoxylon sp. CO27-5]